VTAPFTVCRAWVSYSSSIHPDGTLRVLWRVEVPCPWCGTRTVRWHPVAVGQSLVPFRYCNPLHRKEHEAKRRDDVLTARRAEEKAAVLAAREADEESERRARCPRPDKEGWNTREAVDIVIRHMRANHRPRAEYLRAYQCVDFPNDNVHKPGCGLWHAGDWRAYDCHRLEEGA